MSATRPVIAASLLLSALAVAGCMGTPGVTRGALLPAPASTDTERAIVGAVGGALLAGALDRDILAGAVVGAGTGALCDDAGLCADLD